MFWFAIAIAFISYWVKLPAAISPDTTPSAAGKKRGFCRLRNMIT